MKYILLLITAVALLSCGSKTAEKNVKEDKAKPTSLVVSKLEKLDSGFTFTEGPTSDKNGNVYFTDIPPHLILIWTTDNKLETFKTKSGRANGLFFDKNENLLACEGEKGQITSTSPNGDYKVIASEYNGKRFNQPNDLWADNKGGIYFTDPKFGKDQDALSQDGMHVYYITPNHDTVIRVCDDLGKPNGVIGTADGKTLYITDVKAGKTYKYDVQEDGTLTNKTVFIDVACDGMTIDTAGNLYVTTLDKHAVDIFSPAGKLLETIQLTERVSNLCFTGKDNNELFITARSSIYRVGLSTKGVE